MSLILKNISVQDKLKGISLEVRDGEIVIIAGPEGGGKDEIFKVITGELAIDSGEIILNGEVVRGKEKMGAIFEDYIIYKRKYIRGLYFFSYRRWLKRVDDKKLAIVSELMGMDRNLLLSSSPRHLSKGEQKRFDLARYLITKREVILLENPLIGLDWPRSKTTLANLKAIVKRFNQPCLYKADSEKECEELKGRAVLVRKGKIEYCGDWRPGLII